jgi:hypothetical protein
MDRPQLSPIADVLADSYLDALGYSHRFLVEHGQPPTLAAKVHHMRSVTQSMINHSEQYTLGTQSIEFGRVEIGDTTTGRCYLLRSDGAVKIERHMSQRETLFPAAQYLASAVVLLIYRFHRAGLDLSVAGTKHQVGKRRLEISGQPTFVGMWAWSTDGPSPFDQGFEDPFGDIGDLGEGDTGEGDTG